MISHFKMKDFRVIECFLVVFAVAFTGCKNAGNNDSLLFEELNESLAQSNAIILVNISSTIESLTRKREDPSWAEKAIFWKEKAENVRYQCDLLAKLIHDLGDTASVASGNVSMPGIKNLYRKLKRTRETILSIHPDIDREFRGQSSMFCNKTLDNLKNEEAFYVTLFDNVDSLKLKNLLLKFENNVRTAEYRVVNFCNNKVGGCILTYSKLQAFVSQNSTQFKPGEELLIQAGVGVFNNQAMPKFEINQQIVDAENGAARYKVKVSSKPGRYSIPIQINYVKPDGTRQVFQDSVRYIVDE